MKTGTVLVRRCHVGRHHSLCLVWKLVKKGGLSHPWSSCWTHVWLSRTGQRVGEHPWMEFRCRGKGNFCKARLRVALSDVLEEGTGDGDQV